MERSARERQAPGQEGPERGGGRVLLGVCAALVTALGAGLRGRGATGPMEAEALDILLAGLVAGGGALLVGQRAGGVAGLVAGLLLAGGAGLEAGPSERAAPLLLLGLAPLLGARVGRAGRLLAGLSLGLAVLAEPRLVLAALVLAALVLPALVLPLSAWREAGRGGGRGAVLALGGLALVLLAGGGEPWRGMGLELYRGQHPAAGLQGVDELRLPPEPAARAERSRLVASRQAGRWLTAEEVELHWLNAAWTAARADPGAAGWRLLARSRALLVGEPAAALGLGLALLGLGRAPGVALLLAAALAGLGFSSTGLMVGDARLLGVPVALAAGLGVGVLGARPGRDRLLWGGLAGLAAIGLRALPEPGGDRPPLAPCATLDPLPRPAEAIQIQLEQAREARKDGRAAEALARLSALLQADPALLLARAERASILLDRGELRAAEADAAEWVRLRRCDPEAWSALGTAELRQGKVRDAARSFQEAARIDPYEPGHGAALGEALLAIGEEEAGLARLEEAVRWGPKLWQPRAILGRRALTEGRFREAEELLVAALAEAPGRPELMSLLGLARLGQGRVTDAEALHAEAVKLGNLRHPAILALDLAIRRAREAARGALGSASELEGATAPATRDTTGGERPD